MRAAVGVGLCLVAVLSVVGAVSHEKFVPLVAFQCGYRNRYLSAAGVWQSDHSKHATCMQGKLDILKYCKKSYPGHNITNIVEYSHEVEMADWCKEDDDSKCTHAATVRPFRCLEGEFHSEALQVPHGCKFNHENGSGACSDYAHWKIKAGEICKSKKEPMQVRSFAMLEPCGLDMFTGVEFVCCPKGEEKPAAKEITAKDDDEDEDEDDDESSSEEFTEGDEDSKEQLSDKKNETKDEYFNKDSATLNEEHERYKAALEKLDALQRQKVASVMKEWNEMDARLGDMEKKDPEHLSKLKTELNKKFQDMVSSFEQDSRKSRREIEEVHEERVIAKMNEKKRAATHDFRQALAESMGVPDKHNVLKNLKAYIRTEEKDRVHSINRFRHLLRTDTQEAVNIRSLTVHRLKYIDLRINGTIAMLRDFPALDTALSAIAHAYWLDYRRENTPHLSQEQLDEIEKLPEADRDEKVVDMIEADFKARHPNAYKDVTYPEYDKHYTEAPAKTTKVTAKPLPQDESDSEEEDDTYYEDENDEEKKKVAESADRIFEGLKPTRRVDTQEVKKLENEQKAAEAVLDMVRNPIVRPAPKQDEDDDSDSDESDSDEDDTDSEFQKTLRVDIEPIVQERARLPSGYFRQDRYARKEANAWPFTASGYVFLFVAIVFSVFVAFAVLGYRSRRNHIRFVEVDVCSPEEKHMNGMQVNGYENPTYSFFDAKA